MRTVSKICYVAIYRCPICRASLKDMDGWLDCMGCGAKYPVAAGVPVLLRSDNELFSPDRSAVAPNRTPTERSGLRRFLPSLTANWRAAENYARLRELVTAGNDPIILNVGGGEGGIGQSTLGGLRVVTTDVVLGTGTDAVADAHDLPFDDGTFDAVIIQAVLEHVLDPARCVAEVHRVLKPRGLVYAETPFMQQVHMGRYDYTRFTALGHRRLFRMFDEIESGMCAGPGSALAWSLTYFVSSFARSLKERRILNGLARCAFFWLRYTDRFMMQNDAAFDGACGFYFIGRRGESALRDSTLIADYRGGIDL